MTNPQNDVPCRDCKRPTQHESERCDECRSPAGRILTALAARGIKGDKVDSFDVLVGQVLVSADGLSWCLMCEDGTSDHDDNIEAVANAIAAIVQAPGLRAELADVREALMGGEPGSITDAIQGLAAERVALVAENSRLRAELEKPVVGPWRRESSSNQVRWHASAGEGERIAAIVRAPGDWRGAWIAQGFWGSPKSSGPETGDAGRHAADLALVAAGYRLVGGVHPAQGEVSDAR